MILMGMELPLSAVKQQISSGIDVMVHLGRMRDKSRKVLEITEVDGYEDGEIQLHKLYEFVEEGEDENGRILGGLVKKGEIKHDYKLKAAGITIPD